MEYLTDILADFQDRLKSIAKVDGINTELITIFDNDLRSIRKDVEQTGKFGSLLKKIDTQLNMLQQVEHLPGMSGNLEIIREQSVVLMVGAFEVFISDIFKSIANKNPDYFVWPEKDKKISIDIDSFRSSFTLGDAIITHLNNKQYSFQDLGSIIKAVNDYLGVQISVDDETGECIVFGTSCRHLIVHRGSKIDQVFLNQTSDIKGLGYSENDKLKLKNGDILKLRDSIEQFSGQLIETLIQRDVI